MQRVLKQVIKEKMEAMDGGDEEGAGNDCFLGALIRLQKENSVPVELTDNTVMALMFVSQSILCSSPPSIFIRLNLNW